MFIHSKNLIASATAIISILPQLAIAPQCTYAVETTAVTECGGWFEEAYAEWDTNAIGSDVTVSYAAAGDASFTAADAELIRGSRVDIPGLKGNTDYTLKIEGSSGSATCQVRTLSYDRTGYAHQDFSDIGA